MKRSWKKSLERRILPLPTTSVDNLGFSIQIYYTLKNLGFTCAKELYEAMLDTKPYSEWWIKGLTKEQRLEVVNKILIEPIMEGTK